MASPSLEAKREESSLANTKRRGSITSVQMNSVDVFHQPHLNPLTGLLNRRHTLMRAASSNHLCDLEKASDYTAFPNEIALGVRVLSGANLPRGVVVNLSIPGTKGVADGKHPVQTLPSNSLVWHEEVFLSLEPKPTKSSADACGHHHKIHTKPISVPFTLHVSVGAPSKFLGHIVPGVTKSVATTSILMDAEDWPGGTDTKEHQETKEICKWNVWTEKTFPLVLDLEAVDECFPTRTLRTEPPTVTLAWSLTHVPPGSFVRSTLEADLLPVEKRVRWKVESFGTRVTNVQEFLSSLDTGDIFLTIPDPISNIRIDTLHSVSNHFTGSDYVHMGMIIRQHGSRGAKFKRPPHWMIPDFEQDQLQVAESTMGRDGVWCYSMETGFVKTAIFDDYIMVRRLQGVERTREWRMKVEELLEQWVGTPFDRGERGALEMINASLKSPTMAEEYEVHGKVQKEMVEENAKKRRRFFCSEFVSMMYQQLGVLPEGPQTRSDFFTPGSFSREMGTVDKLMAIHGSGASLGPEMLLRYPGSAFELHLRKLASLRAGTELLDERALLLT